MSGCAVCPASAGGYWKVGWWWLECSCLLPLSYSLGSHPLLIYPQCRRGGVLRPRPGAAVAHRYRARPKRPHTKLSRLPLPGRPPAHVACCSLLSAPRSHGAGHGFSSTGSLGRLSWPSPAGWMESLGERVSLHILLSSQFWPIPSMSRRVINCAKLCLSHPFSRIKWIRQWAVDQDPVLTSTTSAKIGKTAISLFGGFLLTPRWTQHTPKSGRSCFLVYCPSSFSPRNGPPHPAVRVCSRGFPAHFFKRIHT